MAKAKIVKHNGSPAICIDGKIYPPMTATVVTSRTPIGGKGRIIDTEYFKNLGESGLKIYYVMCNNLDLEDCAVKDFEDEAKKILSVVPDAYIMVRIPLTPSKKWIEENPDHIVQYSDGHKIPTLVRTETFVVESDGMPSLCSWKWREDMGKTLKRVMNEIDKLPFSDRIVGYFVGGGANSEWFYVNPIEDWDTGAYADTSKAFEVEFQKYLDNKYGAGTVKAEVPGFESRFFTEGVDAKIANPGRVLAAAPEPAPPQNGTNHGSFLDIDKYRNTFDFYRAWTEGSANSIIHFAKIVKEHNPDTLVGSFYGSLGGCEVIWSSNSSAVLKVLDSGVVDFIANPGVYENRQPGGFTGQRQCPDSFALRNTIYIVEDDTRTHAENAFYAEKFEMFSLEDTLNVLKRDFGRNVCENLQGWWYDQHIGGGRYKFPEVYKLFSRQQEIAKLSYSLDRFKGNEIAFIYDEESVHTVSKQTTDELFQVFRNYEIANIGTGADLYFHNDMSNPNMPDYKLYVFCNCIYLSSKEREDIKQKLRKNNAVALFLYGSGMINPDKEKMLDVANVSEFTGINCCEVMERNSPMFKISNTEHKLASKIDKTKIFGSFMKPRKSNVLFVPEFMPRSYLYPTIYAEDSEATTLAKFTTFDKTAVAIKNTDGFTSIYCGSKYISSDFIRETARFAGCHIFEEDNNVLYANKNFITVHAAKTGKITLKFREKCSPFELYEEKYYGKNVTEISFDANLGDTKMFQLK